MNPQKRGRPLFGRLDPFCLLAVVPAVLVAALLVTQGLWLLGLAAVGFAAFVLLFDSWVNRPDPPPPPRRTAPQPRPLNRQVSRVPPTHAGHPGGNPPMRTVWARPHR